jgi:hypothetical protein
LVVATMWWRDTVTFEADARRADESTLRTMLGWAVEHEQGADRPGMGRNPKARHMFGQYRKIAEAELERRRLA